MLWFPASVFGILFFSILSWVFCFLFNFLFFSSSECVCVSTLVFCFFQFGFVCFHPCFWFLVWIFCFSLQSGFLTNFLFSVGVVLWVFTLVFVFLVWFFFFLIHAIWFSHHFSAFSLCCFASVFHVIIQVAAAWLSSLQSAVFQNLLWGQHFPPLCDRSVMALFFPQKDCPGETIHSAMQKCPSLIYFIIQVWKQCSLYILVYKGKNGSYVMMFPVLCFLYQCV